MLVQSREDIQLVERERERENSAALPCFSSPNFVVLSFSLRGRRKKTISVVQDGGGRRREPASNFVIIICCRRLTVFHHGSLLAEDMFDFFFLRYAFSVYNFTCVSAFLKFRNARRLLLRPQTEEWSFVMSMSVCLSVCPRPCPGNHTSELHQIFYACYTWSWLNPPDLAALQYAVLSIFFRFGA